MDITPIEVTVAELVAGYEDKGVGGVVAYGGKLDVRPPYQREFIYDEKAKRRVIDTVMKDYPLGTMYWARRSDGGFEMLDGQQRTISVCSFWQDSFDYNMMCFSNWQADEQKRFLAYKRINVYICEGGDTEKLGWFRTINIAGKALTEQEMRNAIFAGPWVSSARIYFSKPNCAARNIGEPYLKGEMIRQSYLETAIAWVDAAADGAGIDLYMGKHQHDADAEALYSHFQTVINWIKAKFPVYRSQMKGIDWGTLWVKHHNRTGLDAGALEAEVSLLMADEDVTNKRGIYPYVLSLDKAHDERLLSIRAFEESDRVAAYEKQKGICPHCGKHFDIKEMEADHIKPWSKGGHTSIDNCQMLCKMCNRMKSDV